MINDLWNINVDFVVNCVIVGHFIKSFSCTNIPYIAHQDCIKYPR